jgi:hypothetical protein
MADMWSQTLGVDVEIQQVEFATYLQDLYRNRLQAFFGGWEADYPDPQDWIDILFHSESPRNDGNYSNSEVDRLVEQARTEQDMVLRTQLYQDGVGAHQTARTGLQLPADDHRDLQGRLDPGVDSERAGVTPVLFLIGPSGNSREHFRIPQN